MTCKDCIHNEVCYRREVYNDIEEHIRKLGCIDFIARAEIEKLKGSTIVSNIMESQRIKREAKAEAYKEFAEIIKDKWFDNRYDSPDVDFDDFISNLLKEMVGEEE